MTLRAPISIWAKTRGAAPPAVLMLFLGRIHHELPVSTQFLGIRVYVLLPSPAPAHLLRLASHRPKFLGLVQRLSDGGGKGSSSKGPQAQQPAGPHPKVLGCVAATRLQASAPKWSLLVWELGEDEMGPLNEGGH